MRPALVTIRELFTLPRLRSRFRQANKTVRLFREVFQSHWEALGAPVPRRASKDSGTRGSAIAAAAVVREMPLGHHVPVPSDDLSSTVMAVGAAAGFVVHVAGIGVADPVLHRDSPGPRKGFGRSMRLVQHFPVRMERSKVYRHIRPELLHDPLGEFFDLGFRVILAGYQ